MSIDEVKEYLDGYRFAVKKEKHILDRIQEMRINEMFPSVSNDGMPKGSDQRDLSDYAVQIDELMDELKEAESEVDCSRRRIEAVIKKLDEPKERRFIKLKYIELKDCKYIADDLGISYRHATRLHGSILQNISCNVL